MPEQTLAQKLRELADKHEVNCVEVEPMLRAAAGRIEDLERSCQRLADERDHWMKLYK